LSENTAKVWVMAKLKGKNQIRQFRQIAGTLTSKIIQYRGVAGIIFLGGLVKGFTDKYSDVDIIVLLHERDQNLKKIIQKIGSDEKKRSSVDVDIEIHFLEDFNKWKWDETRRWDFSRVEIAFDLNEEIQELIRKKMMVSESFWMKRIVICGEHLRWHCCSSEDNVGTIIDAWIERGDLASAHYCLNYAFDLLIRLIFALNREFLPAPKWRLFYSYGLKWLPKDYRNLLGEAMTVKALSTHDLNRRLKALKTIWTEILPKLQHETGLTSKLISKHYVHNMLHQT
jgi:predicted nucleotidyltransferase